MSDDWRLLFIDGDEPVEKQSPAGSLRTRPSRAISSRNSDYDDADLGKQKFIYLLRWGKVLGTIKLFQFWKAELV